MINRNTLLYTPIIIFSIVWGVTIFLYLLNPFNLEPIRSYTAFVMFLGISMVYIGFLTPKFINNGFSIKQYCKPFNEFPFDLKKVKILIIILTLVSFIGTIGNIYLISKAVGGFSMFLVDPDSVRNLILDIYLGKADVPINRILFKIFSYLTSLISITVVIAGAVSTKKGLKIITVLPLILVLIISISNLQRFFFIKHYFFWIISSFVFLYYHPTDEQRIAVRTFIWQLISFIIFTIVFAIVILVIRLLLKAGVDLTMIYNSLYFYIAGTVFWLDKYLLTDPDPYYGLSLFRSFIRWFAAFGLMDQTSVLSPHYEFYKLYNTIGNTFGFFRIPYEDFGIFGIIIIPYIWGWIGYYIMKKYLEKFTFVRLGLVAIILFSFFLSFFGFYVTAITSFIWKLFLLNLIDIYLRKTGMNKIFNE